MSLDEKQGASASPDLYRVIRYFLPAAAIICVVAAFIYRIETIHWPEDISSRALEWTILILCMAVLLVLFFIGSWLLVRTQISEYALRADVVLSEARLKALFQTIPDLIWLKNQQGIYLACNPAFERFFGSKESEIVGKTDYDFVDAELADAFRANDRSALAAGNARANEEWVTLADDGRRVLLETIKVPVRTTNGDIVGVLGISRDITRRHEAERDVLMYRNLVELSGDPIYVMDQNNNRMIFVNSAACNHFGASKEEILGWTVFNWDPDITTEALGEIQAKINASRGVYFETRHRTSSGAIIPVEVSANNLSLSDGRNLSAGYIRNISERKKAEEALRQSHQQLIKLTSNAPGVVYQYQRFPDGRFSIPFISSTVEELYGIAPEEIYDNPSLPFSFTHPDDVERLDNSIKESARTMHPWHCEYRVNLPEKGARWLLGNSRPELQEDGSIIWHGFITDITGIKRTEESLRDYQVQLRHLVAHHDRIREDERKRIALEIHDELGQYLLAMRIDVSLLSDQQREIGVIDESVKNILRQIDDTMKRVRAIINNLRPSVLDLGLFAALEWQLKEFERYSGIAYRLVGIEDELHVGENLATTLFRVMQEALDNVHRHANATLVTINLHKDEHCLIMSVADNGIGINGDELRGGVDRFGLLGVRERIAMMGGLASIESQNGTVLTISLPLNSKESNLMN